jgi:hypothetical protein
MASFYRGRLRQFGTVNLYRNAHFVQVSAISAATIQTDPLPDVDWPKWLGEEPATVGALPWRSMMTVSFAIMRMTSGVATT